MKTIVLATCNSGKLREFNALLNPLALTLVSQADFAVSPVAETGLSFVENALIKARHAAHCSGLPALADDSGLEVDALGGAPGIYSARYAGPAARDAENNSKLLTELAGVAVRSARFRCALVLVRQAEDPNPLIAQGVWEGEILHEARGHHGFGYDPLFLVPGEGCSAAELPAEVKNRLSHRARALEILQDMLRSEWA